MNSTLDPADIEMIREIICRSQREYATKLSESDARNALYKSQHESQIIRLRKAAVVAFAIQTLVFGVILLCR